MNDVQDYIINARASREADAQAMLDAEEAGEEYEGYEDVSDAIAELPLSVEVKTHVIITLSTGGPHEEIDCEVSRTGYGYELDSATFGAYWGSDKREDRIYEGSALWRLAERYVESAEGLSE